MLLLFDFEKKDEVLEFRKDAETSHQDFKKLSICTQATVRVTLSNERHGP